MHFLLIHQAFVAPGEPGGTRHYELIQGCLEKDHRFTVIASSISYLTGSALLSRGGVQEEVHGNLRILRVSPLSGLHSSFVRRVASFVSFMFLSMKAIWKVGSVDAVIGTSPPIFQALSAWLAAVRFRCPFVFEIRDLWPEFAIELGVLRNRFLIWASRRLERFFYRRATKIVVNSPAYRDYLVDLGVTQEIVLVPNGVNASMFHPDSRGEEVRREFGLEGKFLVTYCGALGLANDLGTVLGAANRLRGRQEIHFLLVGDGKEKENLLAQAREAKLANVTFTGSRPKSEVPRFLAASNACVATLQDIPMFRTTYPNKVFDYMAAGRPTILAIDGVIRKVVDEAQAGLFVPPGDPAALAEAVERICDDPSMAEKMGQAGRKYVVDHFDRSRQATAFERLLRGVVDDRHSLHPDGEATA